MKTIIKSVITLLFVTFIAGSISAQEKQSKIDTAKFEVKGVCKMCKERIENAALIKGVKWVEWDKLSDTLTVIYRKDKLELIKVHNSIAEAGHATNKVECNKEAYDKLPACCAYLDGVKKH